MEHMDEKILKAKKQMEEKEAQRHSDETIEEELKQSIYDSSIQIYGIPVRFEDKSLIEDRIVIRLPEDFKAASEENIAQRYILGNKPQYLFENDYLYFSVGFNKTNHPVPNSAIDAFSKVAKTIIERIGPQVKIFETSKFHTGDYEVATLEFLSRAIDQTIYNQMFYASLDDQLLIGFVNFPAKYVKRLKPIADEIIHSFKINDREESEV